jgi:beta-glucosidase
VTTTPDAVPPADDLTLEEKVSLTLGSDFWHTAAVDRAGVPAIMVSDGPHGLRAQPTSGDHVGIGGSLPATCFPPAAALGSSWDPDLVREVGAAIGREARDQGVGVVLGPGINIKRSPLCGRNFEYLSEDPLVAGVLGAAMVAGLQSQGVGASVKHFAANNQETDRLRVSADVDERTLREIYLPAFERVVTQAKPWTVMCSYNRVNGVYASEHPWLLTTVLRDEWGFDGLVVSDWGAVQDRVAALAAGLDLEMPPSLGVSDVAVAAAVRDGSLAEALLDTAARRVLALVGRVTAGAATPVDPVDADAQHAIARRAAAESCVLLRNEPVAGEALLPLRPAAGDVVAVVGEFARTPRYQGAGSSQVNPTRVDAALDALRDAVPAGVSVEFAAGFGIDDTADDAALAAAAVELAGRAGTVVAFLGLPADAESEGYDRTHIDLPAAQTELVAALAAANPRLVVVLANGSAVDVASWRDHAPAILESWLTGQAGGGAIADLLLGAVNPSGRLTETLPLRLSDNPASLNFPGEEGHVRYGEGVFVGYRGFDATGRDVAYPFGHGLSYTTFGYADLTAAVSGTSVEVGVTVTNTGDRAGREVVQLYVGDPEAAIPRPPRELRGFEKVALEPGESARVTFRLTDRDLSYWSTLTGDSGGWTLEAGDFEIAVGASSRDLRLTATVHVDAPPLRRRLDGNSTLVEWLTDPAGGPALRAEIGTSPDGRRAAGILADDGLVKVIGNFPLCRLATFPGIGFTLDTIADLTARLNKVTDG